MNSPLLPLILINAWNESGGGFLHRLFDGHPQLSVTPYELQLGTGLCPDSYANWFSNKYRWPVLPESLDTKSSDELWDLFIDDEHKSHLDNPDTSKHTHYPFIADKVALKYAFGQFLSSFPRARYSVVNAYIRAIFAAWENRVTRGMERFWLTHCPTVILDADKFMEDFENIRLIHLIRSPLTGYVDFRRRVPDANPLHYGRKWTLINMLGFHALNKWPKRTHLVVYEELLCDRSRVMNELCNAIGIEYDNVLLTPTYNKQQVTELMSKGESPFGGVAIATQKHDEECLLALSDEEKNDLMHATRSVISLYDDERLESYVPL